MRHLSHILILLIALIIIICPILWTGFPYSESALLPITYNRMVELNPISRTITSSALNLRMNDKTGYAVKGIEFNPKNRQKEPKKSSPFDLVSYDLDPPKLPDYSQYKPKLSNYTKLGGNLYQFKFEFDFPDTKICRIIFDQPVTNLYMSQLNSDFISMQDLADQNRTTYSLKLTRNDNKLSWTLKLENPANSTDISLEITSICYFFNAEDLANVVNKVPSWLVLWTRDFGQLSVKTRYTLKP